MAFKHKLAVKHSLTLKQKLAALTSNPFFHSIYFPCIYLLAALALIAVGVAYDKIWCCNVGGLLIAVPIGWTFYQTFTEIFLPREN